MVRAVRKLGVPVVDVRQRYRIERIPAVNTDDAMTVALALDHLRERGLQQFAFCGFAGANYSRDRSAHFRARLAADGRESFVYEGRPTSGTLDTTSVEESEIDAEAALGDWLESLPRPIGIVAANDIRAQQVLSVCRQRRLLVPEEAAVIGVDNDEVLCELCDPPLSSVQPDVRGIGYQAAAILDAMMRGEDAPPETVCLPPLGVVVRRSTDVLAIADRQTATALRLIHEQACRGISVQDVVRQLALSRSTLERKFAASVGRSPKDEIERVRLERIKQMLTETRHPLRVIADRTGFPFPEYLNTFFKHHTGETPAAFRRRMEQEEGSPVAFSDHGVLMKRGG